MQKKVEWCYPEPAGSKIYLVNVCLVATLGGLLFGYDTAVISGAIGYLQTRFNLSPAMTGWAASCALAGCMLGCGLAGTVSDHLGRKKVLILSAVFFLVSAVGTAAPRNLTEFVIFRILGGVGVGAASMSSPMYIAEISPARIRGRMVSLNQFAIIFGMLVVYFVNYFIARYGAALDGQAMPAIADGALDSWNVQWGWRWMFGSESVPALMLLVLMFLVPESPRWLVEKGRRPTALGILSRVGGAEHARVQMMEIEQAIAQESGSLAQLFRPGMKIVLVIGVVLAVLQQVTGINVFLYYAPEIFKKLGTGTDTALLQTVVVGAVNLTFTVIAIWTVDKLGRKLLLMVGAGGMGVSLWAIGLSAYYQKTQVWVLIFILGYIACFALAMGPVVWVVLSEIFPTKIRGRAMAISAFFLWGANWVVSQTFPMMDQNDWLIGRFHHAFPFVLYGILCGATVWFVRRWVPETKGKSLEEIEKMWRPAK